MTKEVKSTTSPIWNETFDLNDIEEEDLVDLSVEITLVNRYFSFPTEKSLY